MGFSLFSVMIWLTHFENLLELDGIGEGEGIWGMFTAACLANIFKDRMRDVQEMVRFLGFSVVLMPKAASRP